MRLHCTLVNVGIECDAGAYTQVYEAGATPDIGLFGAPIRKDNWRPSGG
jgi:hypothetical protein